MPEQRKLNWKVYRLKYKDLFYIRSGFALLVIGLVGLSVPFLSFGFLSDYAFLYETAKNIQAVGQNNQFVSEIQPPAVVRSAPDPNLPTVTDRLLVSKINVSMPLFAGDNPKLLLKGGWLFPGTSTPDKGGNTVIFGHRFRYLPPVSNTFYALDKVAVGDEFTLSWQGIEYRYRVIETKIIEPTDLSVLKPSRNPQITLITCSPLFSVKQRLVVMGELVK